VTDAASPADEAPDNGRSWHEALVTVLLVVGAVATAWSSYQATRWNGEQAVAAGRTSAIRIEAARTASLADAQTQVDVATYIAWADADRRGETELAEFYTDRFRPEFQTAFAAWLETDPLVNADAPSTPFVMPEYQVAKKLEAEQLDEDAEASAARVQTNIQRASNYVLTVVLYTVVLLFAGMSAKMSNRRLRAGMVIGGSLVLLLTLLWVGTFPVSVAV
jgi:hypothetical protein